MFWQGHQYVGPKDHHHGDGTCQNPAILKKFTKKRKKEKKGKKRKKKKKEKKEKRGRWGCGVQDCSRLADDDPWQGRNTTIDLITCV